MSRRSVVLLSAVTAVTIGGVYFAATRRTEELPPVPELSPPENVSRTDPHRPYPYGRVVVLATGINHYPRLTGEETTLRFAEADAIAFADLSAVHFGYEPRRLVGPAATKRAIEDGVKRAAEELGPEDALVVFFAGHGQVVELPGAGEAGFLLPHDAALDMKVTARPDAWREQAVNVHDLFATAAASRARHVLFVLDACRSGIATGRGAVGDRADMKAFLFEKSRTVLTAVRRDQSARENAARGHGEFTAALLDRLKSGDPATVLDVYQHVSREVAARTNSTMLPQFAQVEGDGMLVFIPKAVPRSELERDLRGVPVGPLAAAQSRAADARTQRTTADDFLDVLRTSEYRAAVDAEDQRKRWEPKVERFGRNAGLGDANGMAALSLCYARGIGTRADPALALDWARQADRAPHEAGVGRYVLGRCSHDGVGVPKNPALAERLFRESAAAGFLPSELAVAELVIAKKNSPAADIAAAVASLERGVAARIPSPAVTLGRIYMSGVYPGVAKDATKALGYWEQAAGWEDPQALFLLFAAWREPTEGTSGADVARAKNYLDLAVARGDTDALLALAHERSARGSAKRYLGLAANDDEALRLARLAASGSGPSAAGAKHLLSEIHEHGWGVVPDATAAKTWCEAAAADNFAAAFATQGRWWETGRINGNSDAAKAAAAYRRAADLGHRPAYLKVVDLYERLDRRDPHLNPHWKDILHYLVLEGRAGASEAAAYEVRMVTAYKKYVEVPAMPEATRRRWDEFARDYPEGARFVSTFMNGR